MNTSPSPLPFLKGLSASRAWGNCVHFSALLLLWLQLRRLLGTLDQMFTAWRNGELPPPPPVPAPVPTPARPRAARPHTARTPRAPRRVTPRTPAPRLRTPRTPWPPVPQPHPTPYPPPRLRLAGIPIRRTL